VNHLAHLRLAPPDPRVRAGALLGDFARGLDVQALPAPTQQGLLHHRAIDRFTDAHPAFAQSRARVQAPLRRFAGVLVDVFYDHFLADGWPEFGDGRPLGAFTAEVYAQLQTEAASLPPALAAALPRMIRNDWLAQCRTDVGVAAVLARIAARLRRPVPLADAVADLQQQRPAFAADFALFWRDVAAFAASMEHGPEDQRAS
jgi:acyl carrier protein phosphodiesterase